MKEYPTFKRGEVQNKYNKFSSEDKKIIDSFLKYVSITSQSKNRIKNNLRSLAEFRIITGKELQETNLEDLRIFLSLLSGSNKTQATRNDLKASVKRFLKWHFKDWSKRFDNLSDIKLVVRMNEEKINADTLPKKEEIEKIMKEERSLFWRTFFITLHESGLRPNELRNLKWSNIKINAEGDISEINIFATKTHRARSVYVKEATKYLLMYKKKQQEQGLTNDLVFPAPRDKNRPIGKNNVSEWLRSISKRVLGRSIYPYMLRHTRATELYTNAGIPDKIVQKFLGHSKSMADVYTHLSNKDVKEALGKTIYNFEELPPEKKSELEERIKNLETKEKNSQEVVNVMAGFLKEFMKLSVKPDEKRQAFLVKTLEAYKEELKERNI
jgi:integrase